MRRNNRQSGFSMLEVMAGLGLMVVIGGISTPVASEYMKSYRLVSATDSVANEIRGRECKRSVRTFSCASVPKTTTSCAKSAPTGSRSRRTGRP